MNAEWFSWNISATNIAIFGAATLLLPPTASIWLRHLAIRCAANQRSKWVGYTRWVSLLMIVAVPIYWSLGTVIDKSGTALSFMSAVPLWALILTPLPIATFIARLISYRADAHLFGRQWTPRDICQLAFWRTISSTVALLLVATGLEEIYSRNIVGLIWMLGAGMAALIGSVRLRAAEGLIPRPVKSGELYKRSLVMAKRMRVPLRQVCVVPFGRGRLTNAYGGRTRIAITDDYGHWLQGSQLDFVVAHELAHVKQRDAVKTVLTMAVVFALLSATTFGMPRLPIHWRILFNFVSILFPLMVFYALSRRHEYVADRLAVKATNEPETAIRALAGLYRHTEVPVERSRFLELFSTHPGLWRRIDAIARFGGVAPEQVSEVRMSFTEAAEANVNCN